MEANVPKKKPKIKMRCVVTCSCGATHSFKEWQKCPMALMRKPLEPWWRKDHDGAAPVKAKIE